MLKNFIKKKYILSVLCLATSVVYSQILVPEITERDWYLIEVNIDGLNVEIPTNDELMDVSLNFEDVSPHFRSAVCNSLEGDVARSLNGLDEFFFPTGLIQTLIECDLGVNTDFERVYFSFFYDNSMEPFSFNITIVDDPPNAYYYLGLIVPNGDYVIYGDTPRLGVEDQEKDDFLALPNPVSDQLLIKTPQTLDIAITIYDVIGQEVFKEATQTNREIQTSGMKSGLYFVKITTADGREQTLKFIKN